VTLDNSSDITSLDTSNGSPAPAKAPRRRATRTAAAPSAPSAAGTLDRAPADLPVQAAGPKTTRARRGATEPTASASVAPATTLTEPTETQPAARAAGRTRSRSRSAVAPSVDLAEDLAPAVASPAADVAATPATEDAPVRSRRATAAAKAPAKRAPSSRTSKKGAADEPLTAAERTELAVQAPTSAATFDVFAELALTKPPRRAARRASAPQGSATATAAKAAAAELAAELAAAELAAAELAAAELAAAELAAAQSAELAAAELAASEAEEPAGPAYATSLFQSADATTRPRRRRAQSPAGPPRVAQEPAVVDDARRTPFEAAPASARTPDGSDVETDAGQRAPAKRASRRRGSARSAGPADEALASTETDAADAGTDGWGQPSLTGSGAGDQTDDEVAVGQAAEGHADDDDEGDGGPRRRRRRGGRGRRGRSGEGGSDNDRSDQGSGEHHDENDQHDQHGSVQDDGAAPAAEREPGDHADDDDASDGDEGSGSSRRRRRRRRSGRGGEGAESDQAAQPTRTRQSRSSGSASGATASDEVTALRGSTRLEAKRQRRREGRDAGRRRTIITESEFLARRESVDRTMVVREINGATQIAVMEDGVLVEHYVSRQAQASMAGNVYLGRVQNVLPSMEAAFVDVGKGRNAVLYAGEVNWDAAGLEGQPRRIEQALKSGDSVLVQVTKDPIGQKGARLTSQVTLAGRYLVYVPGGGMTGISRKLPENERARLKKLLREIVPDSAGVIVRTAAEGASEDELRADIARLQEQWTAIEKKAKSASAPALLQGEPDLAIRVVRDIFNGDFGSLVVQGDEAWDTISGYIDALAPDLAQKVTRWTGGGDVFSAHRVDEQLAKGMDRKVWLPSGGSLVIDRTEAMTVVDVNTGKFTGAGGTLEETVTRNNLEAAEEIVRQLRLRDIGGIIVIDFIDMVLESNRDLVLRRLVECLGRDRTKHQVAEVTSLGLVQMTRKRVGQGLVEAFSETCEHCMGRGFIVHTDPVEKNGHANESHGTGSASNDAEPEPKGRRKRGGSKEPLALTPAVPVAVVPVLPEARAAVKATLATIAAAAAHAHDQSREATGAPVASGYEGDVRQGSSGPADLPFGFDSDEALELFPVAPEVFGADDQASPVTPE